MDAIHTSERSARLTGRSWQGIFTTLSILCCVIAMFGFIPVYYLPVIRGTGHFPLLLHLHAGIATTWLIMLMIQSVLVRRRNLKIHRKLGMFALGVAVIMVPLTLLAIRGMITRHDPPGALERGVFFPQVASLFLFFAFVLTGYLWRHRAEWHKRLMILGTTALLGTPIARITWLGINANPPLMVLLWDAPILILLVYELIVAKRIHRATWTGILLLVVMQVLTLILMDNALWSNVVGKIADWLR